MTGLISTNRQVIASEDRLSKWQVRIPDQKNNLFYLFKTLPIALSLDIWQLKTYSPRSMLR